MNKKAVGQIGAILLFIVFIVIWFVALGSWVNTAGLLAVYTGNLTGVEAFFFENLNLVIFIVVILAIMGWSYFGGQQ